MKRLTLFPSPLVGEGGSNERSSFETGEGFFPQAQNCVGGENPSSGVSRHLLPQGEKGRKGETKRHGCGGECDGIGGGGRSGGLGSRQAPADRPAIIQYIRPATMPAPVMISR